MGEIPTGLTPDEEAAFERWANTPPPQTPEEVIDSMAQSFGETLTEALKHIDNLLDVADNCVVVDEEAQEAVSAARRFWNDMNPPDKYDGADDPRYR